jgi:hypothetical protein
MADVSDSLQAHRTIDNEVFAIPLSCHLEWFCESDGGNRRTQALFK